MHTSDQNESKNEECKEHEVEAEVKLKKKRGKNKKQRIIINLNHCHYPVLRTVAKIYKLRTTINDDDDWDIFWSDAAI